MSIIGVAVIKGQPRGLPLQITQQRTRRVNRRAFGNNERKFSKRASKKKLARAKSSSHFYKMRMKKLAHFKKIKKFISISDKHLIIVDKKLLVIFRQKRASFYVIWKARQRRFLNF
jgi:hypothetical protein